MELKYDQPIIRNMIRPCPCVCVCVTEKEKQRETAYVIVKYVTVVKYVKCDLYPTQNSQQNVSGQMETLTKARWSQNIPTVSVFLTL